jgi:hypothetical protein
VSELIGDGSGVALPPFDATIERVFTPMTNQQSHCRPASFVEFCTAHNQARCGCLREDLHIVADERAVEMQRATLDKLQWQAVERGLPALERIPPVSLPSAPVVERAPAEETRVVESDGLPPPTGWRDRPGLL